MGGKFLDLRAIDSVSFKLGEISSGPEPVFISDFKTLQLAISCPGKFIFSNRTCHNRVAKSNLIDNQYSGILFLQTFKILFKKHDFDHFNFI